MNDQAVIATPEPEFSGAMGRALRFRRRILFGTAESQAGENAWSTFKKSSLHLKGEAPLAAEYEAAVKALAGAAASWTQVPGGLTDLASIQRLYESVPRPLLALQGVYVSAVSVEVGRARPRHLPVPPQWPRGGVLGHLCSGQYCREDHRRAPRNRSRPDTEVTDVTDAPTSSEGVAALVE